MTFVFNILYVRWCSACVEGAFKHLIIACAGSTKQLITTQTCRVYKYFTSVQSVTSALSVFQRLLNCQTKRILIGLPLYCSVIGRPSRDLEQKVSSVMFSHLLDDTLIITLPTEAYTGHWLSIKLSKSVKWDIPAWSINKINEFPIRRRDINHVIW